VCAFNNRGGAGSLSTAGPICNVCIAELTTVPSVHVCIAEFTTVPSIHVAPPPHTLVPNMPQAWGEGAQVLAPQPSYALLPSSMRSRRSLGGLQGWERGYGKHPYSAVWHARVADADTLHCTLTTEALRPFPHHTSPVLDDQVGEGGLQHLDRAVGHVRVADADTLHCTLTNEALRPLPTPYLTCA